MSIGARIRGMFGPYERQITEAYRSVYIDLSALIAQMLRWKPEARRILEVGCGEGAVTERLRAAYPDAFITAIDITPRLGRQYAGSRANLRFVQCTVQEVAAAEPGRFDLVILSDVLHHVPLPVRQDLLDAIRRALAPDGMLIFKEWERIFSPIYWICYASDRWLTGDRIRYMTRDEMRAHLSRTFGEASIAAEARIGPWMNNLAMLVRPPAAGWGL